MIYGLKVLLREPFYYLTKPSGRNFIKLCVRFGTINRFEKRTFKLFGNSFTFVDSWSFLWQYYDIFFRKSYFFSTQTQRPVIIDCGGNVGASVLFFKQIYPKALVKCFEADPFVYDVLKENTKHLEDVEIVNQAVWSHNKGIKMRFDHADSAHVADDGETISSVRLADELSRHERIDLLKMDVEGAEFEVLKDCKNALQNVNALFVEVHTFENQPQQFSELLKIVEEAGFRYYLEQAAEQKEPLKGDWKVSSAGMDVQLNLFCIRV